MKKRMILGTLMALLGANTVAFAAGDPQRATISEQYDDWSYVCVEQDKRKVCESRIVINNDQGQPVVIVGIVMNQKDKSKTALQISVPLMSDLKKSVALNVDGKKVKDLGYAFCGAQGCFLIEELNGPLLSALKGGTEASLEFGHIMMGDVTAKISLKGFSSSYQRLME